jgi:hypothetical protein
MNIWNPPDWHAIEAIGTWVAAIGTIGAVFVALGLARRDTKSRRIRHVRRRPSRSEAHGDSYRAKDSGAVVPHS